VKSVDPSVEAQSVTVVADDGVTLEDISQAIQATGKEVRGGEAISIGENNKAD
jgi:copper chaperone CopZ